MKKRVQILSILLILLCLAAAGRFGGRESPVTIGMLPQDITQAEASGFYNGTELAPWKLEPEEIGELRAWAERLSLRHRTYAEGEAPNEIWCGGASYRFSLNGGEKSFAWLYIDQAYIRYGGEWYEITNTSVPPLNLNV